MIEPQDLFASLTPRQAEIMSLDIEGMSIKEIAAKLGISPYTVDAAKDAIVQRLKLDSRNDLAAWSVRQIRVHAMAQCFAIAREELEQWNRQVTSKLEGVYTPAEKEGAKHKAIASSIIGNRINQLIEAVR